MEIKLINAHSQFGKRLLKIIMKTFIFLMCTTVFCLTTDTTFSQEKIMIEKDQLVTVDQVFKIIKKQTEFDFVYPRRIFKNKPKVQLNKGEIAVTKLLEKSLSSNNLSYELTEDKTILIKEKPIIKEVEVQQHQVTGQIKGENGLPLPGANILEKGTSNGTQTDFDGKFSFRVSNADATLVISYIGFIAQEINLKGQATLKVTLIEDTESLDEVIVVGYGTQKKSDVTGSVASLDAKIIEAVPVTNLTQVVQGRLPGVLISSDGGGAEGLASIQIRGQNSLTASNSPLVILDGIPFSGSLSFINPNDISSFEVLKDASSTAIYGARASNGVILITTKKGTSGKPTITYNGNTSFSEVINLPNLMNGETFYNRKLEFFQLENPSLTPQDIFTPTELEVYNSGEFVNWAELGTRSGTRQEHNISISGGSEQSNYFVSLGVNNTEGVAVNDKFDRYNLRINYDTNINDWLTIGTNTLLGYIDRSGRPIDFDFNFGDTHSLRMNPLTRVRNPDGTLTIYPWAENVFYANPLGRTNYIQESIIKSVNTNNYLEIKLPVDGLSYRLNTGYTSRHSAFESYRGLNTKVGFENGGSAVVDNSTSDEWVIENILNYKKEFGKHNIFLTALYSSQKNISKQRQVSGRGFPNDIRTSYQFNSADITTFVDNFDETSFLSQMFRANYGFDSRYLLTFTVRRDGYSGFGETTKFGTFPSIALAWNIANEPFMDSANFINNLKLRATYGENGNQAIGAYSTLAGLSSNFYLDSNRNTAVGFYPRSLGDPSLSWETSKSMNFGLDFGFLKNRIQGSIDYFSTKTTDLLLDRVISPINGASRITQNIGETETNGFEFQLSSTNISKPDFSWSTDFNFSLYRTKIVNVGLVDEFGVPTDDVASRWFLGKPIDVFFGHIFDGIWQQGDDIANSAQPDALPGDVRYADLNDDGVINDDDRGIQGDQQPDFIAGMNNTIRYKNVTLNFFIHTVQGIDRSNPLWATFYNDYNENIYDYDFWSESNPTNNFPANRTGINPLGAKPRGDGSFIRLKDVTLSYKFEPEVLSKIKMKDLEVFVNVKNVFTITDYEFGWDPEFSSSASIPLNRSYTLGLRIGI